ncbi:type I restriction enzyme specificity protein HsdS [Canicola haemoglobinophilus]|uniref:Type I restriction enzyme specificity protein HsdS n=1 Tax=Canicola haemoglobinophilus TaxID=733 RepID=A0AB38H608_9PAST|nr:restriction endonuclease subunit S [Canicola haemoglobinophilus]STO54619.1 type I restriction enzyme specificity protein HsdS [Canicola haemoglobinophilus]STO67606.1 type I restriction enzyme specificity protein HsdS [Canicola haemoglobinophilus]
MKTNILKMIEQAEVEWKPLGEVVDVKTGQSINKQKIENNQGIYPVINSGREPLGYINEWNTENDPIGVTTRGAGVGSITWQEGKYFRGNLNYSVTIKDSDELDVRFLFHLLLHFQKQIHSLCTFTGIPALNASELKTLLIPVPKLELQKEIVKILDILTELNTDLTTALETEHILRKKQYQYYRDLLLSESELAKVGFEWKTLGEVASYSKSRISFEKLDESNYVGVDNLLQNRAGKTLSNYVPTSGNLTEFIKDDILIGNIRPYLKKIWHADCMGGTNGDVLVIRVMSQKINPRYLYQVLADDKFFDYNMKHAKGAKMPRGNKEAILNYQILIPSLETQAKIVAILDKFDRLTNFISDGLPKEIELRRKQYEYYREMLLNFPNS